MTIIKNIIWSLLGIAFGILINDINIIITDKYKINNTYINNTYIQNITQIIICSLTIALIQYYNNYFGWSWQQTTPGFFFVSFFFGTQFKLLDNMSKNHILTLT